MEFMKIKPYNKSHELLSIRNGVYFSDLDRLMHIELNRFPANSQKSTET